MRSISLLFIVLLLTIDNCSGVVRRTNQSKKSSFFIENFSELFESDDCDNVSSESENCEDMFLGFKSDFARSKSHKKQSGNEAKEDKNHALCCFLLEIEDFRSKCCEIVKEVCRDLSGECVPPPKPKEKKKRKKKINVEDNEKSEDKNEKIVKKRKI